MNISTEKLHIISQSNFLITGGAGFIGSHIVEFLLKNNAKKVVVLDNLSTGFIKNLEPYLHLSNFNFIQGDIRNWDTCTQAMEGIDFVSHQAALGSVPRSIKDPITTNQVNIDGFLNILTAARDAKVKKMVYAASSSTYGTSKELPKVEDKIGKPLSPYAITKYVNELYAEIFSSTYNFHSVGLRYFNVFGPRQDPNGAYAAVIPLFFKAAIQNQPPTINGDGETSRDFTFILNAVEANIKGLLNTDQLTKHEVCNVAYGEATTLNELWDAIKDITKTSVEAIYGETRIGDIKHSLADISKARNTLQYNPAYSIKEGLQIASKWYIDNL
ncbi:SDR family oxidoreductase [Polluticaenibacter yanchengensis]|uniref:SDR family oxidoreductase n=1 Tax=Polluticaenibacter yanchengensis TaxID=3014562 RepID=A0ABT4UJZ1_9BACT|nr:SDR family oxidoreductase [Chitinophagaceae bacterium LY-5]